MGGSILSTNEKRRSIDQASDHFEAEVARDLTPPRASEEIAFMPQFVYLSRSARR